MYAAGKHGMKTLFGLSDSEMDTLLSKAQSTESQAVSKKVADKLADIFSPYYKDMKNTDLYKKDAIESLNKVFGKEKAAALIKNAQERAVDMRLAHSFGTNRFSILGGIQGMFTIGGTAGGLVARAADKTLGAGARGAEKLIAAPVAFNRLAQLAQQNNEDPELVSNLQKAANFTKQLEGKSEQAKRALIYTASQNADLRAANKYLEENMDKLEDNENNK
jgi:hypothetical protein